MNRGASAGICAAELKGTVASGHKYVEGLGCRGFLAVI
jgi:hypothetical protein